MCRQQYNCVFLCLLIASRLRERRKRVYDALMQPWALWFYNNLFSPSELNNLKEGLVSKYGGELPMTVSDLEK